MKTTVDEQSVRAKLNEYLDRAGRGGAAELARSGISPAVISKFARGVYVGNSTSVAERLAEIIASREAADLVASGQARTAWLIHRSKGMLQLVKRAETMQAIVSGDPDARVFTVFYGSPGVLKVVE